jgi:hypothetical protein
MLVSKQLTDMLLENTRTIRKESLELRHDCRNTMSVSQLLRELLEQQRKHRSSGALGVFFDPNNPPKGTA